MPADDRFGTPSTFRRREFRAPHRRPRMAWRLVKPLATALLLVGVPAATAYWVLYHPSFALRTVAVEATGRVTAEWVEGRLAPLIGQPLLLVRLADVEARLSVHPWVGGLTVSKELPRGLSVQVTERKPAAILTAGDESHWVDAAGRRIAALDPETGPSDLLRISAPAAGAADVAAVLDAAAEARAVGAAWADAIDAIEVSAVGDLRLHSPELPFPLLVRPQGLEAALRPLPRYLDEIVRRFPDAGAVDLRFVHRIVIQNAARESSREG